MQRLEKRGEGTRGCSLPWSWLLTLLSFTATRSVCTPLPVSYTAGQSWVVWNESLPVANVRARQPFELLISPRQEKHGVVASVHDIVIPAGGIVTFHNSSSPAESNEMRRLYPPSPGKVAGNCSPLLTQASVLLIRLYFSTGGEWPQDCFLLNLSYAVHPMADIPSEVAPEPGQWTDSRVTYECSTIATGRLPSAIRCDLVHQCVGGEDEADCGYRQEGCGDWIPYGRYCLKAHFAAGRGFAPIETKKMCDHHDLSELAVLPDDRGRQLMQRILRQSGLSRVIVGLRKVRFQKLPNPLVHLYRFLWQWETQKSSSVAYRQQEIQTKGILADCAVHEFEGLFPVDCLHVCTDCDGFVCMRKNPRVGYIDPTYNEVSFPKATRHPTGIRTKLCQDETLVQNFHACEFGERPTDLPMFACSKGELVHYSLVCDGEADCLDESDESFPLSGPLRSAMFTCTNQQLVWVDNRCNGVPDCFDGSDENDCYKCRRGIQCIGTGCVPAYYAHAIETCPQSLRSLTTKKQYSMDPPDDVLVLVELDGFGLSDLKETASCPEGYYRCPENLCIPSYMMFNGMNDCLGGEDEYLPPAKCPGYYRCQRTQICVHPDHLCDGIYHCPSKDDELFCDLPCPETCVCEGFAFTCRQMFEPSQDIRLLRVRYLNLSGSRNLSMVNFGIMQQLMFLNLSACGLTSVTLHNMRMLAILDLSDNRLTGLSSMNMTNLGSLRVLNLSRNPLVKTLDSSFNAFLNRAKLIFLYELIMISTNITSIVGKTFDRLLDLKTFVISGNALVNFDEDVFYGLSNLEYLRTDNHKLCCPFFHNSTLITCLAPSDDMSSCSDLLRENFFRVFLWAFSLMAIVGNVGVMVYWLQAFQRDRRTVRAFSVLVVNLCASDLLMGVYMMVIGVADTYYQGRYVSRESEWRESIVCRVAGSLAFLSSEVSAFMICLVTLDRLLMLSFPHKVAVHLSTRWALCACGLAWLTGLMLVLLPLIAGWKFYGQTGVCLPLPITRREFPGQQYAFGIFVILNFVLCLLIGVGQLLIFRAIRSGRVCLVSSRRQRETTIARRLLLIVLTNFLCWFPIGFLGMLASHGVPVPNVFSVWAAIFMLPLNSALNPFLYTVDTLLQRQRQRKRDEMLRHALDYFKLEVHMTSTAEPQDDALHQVMAHLRRNVLPRAPETTLGRASGIAHRSSQNLKRHSHQQDPMSDDGQSPNVEQSRACVELLENIQTPTKAHQTPTATLKIPSEAHRKPTDILKIPSEAYRKPDEIHETPMEAHKTLTKAHGTPTETVKMPCRTHWKPTETHKTPTEAHKTSTEAHRTPTESLKIANETHTEPRRVPKTPSEAHTTPDECQKTAGEAYIPLTVCPQTPAELHAPGQRRRFLRRSCSLPNLPRCTLHVDREAFVERGDRAIERLHTQIGTFTDSQVKLVTHLCLRSGAVDKDWLMEQLD